VIKLPEDYYKILGISNTATSQEIKDAYRVLALKYHPDINKSLGAEEYFKKVNESYAVLSDSEKRKAYDRLGAETFSKNYSTEDIFRNFNYEDVLRDLLDSLLIVFSDNKALSPAVKRVATNKAIYDGLRLFYWLLTKDK
jgi:DnaJ-class molecular chaperone